MSDFSSMKHVSVEIGSDYVATVELSNPPLNFFNVTMIYELADTFEALDKDPACRAIVLAAKGKVFCAGANFGDGKEAEGALGGAAEDAPVDDGKSEFRRGAEVLYGNAARLFGTKKPIVGAIHGAAVGGGLGLSLVPDFRVGCPETRFSANFTALGIHPGFALSYTLPDLIGKQKAHLMFYTSCRVKGEQALEWGLMDRIVPKDQVRAAAHALAAEMANTAPLATMSIRETERQGVVEKIKAATNREVAEQEWLMQTEDAKEGMAAVNERRTANYQAR